jgi:RNA polymerase sigma-70 factor (ECF subfamily)
MKLLSLLFHSREFHRQLEDSRSKLYRVAYAWCHDAALADDLVQETLSKALSKASQLRDQKLLQSWLFSIMSNCWRDHFRRLRGTEELDGLDEAVLVSDSSPEEDHARNQIVSRVRTAIANLPMGQRQVVTLVDLEEFSYAQVAEILNIPVGTVMSRLCRARKELKMALLVQQQDWSQVAIRRIK